MKQKNILFIEFFRIAAANHLMMMMKGLSHQSSCTMVLLCAKDSSLAKEFRGTKVTVYEIAFIDFNIHKPSSYIPYIFTTLLIVKIVIQHKINIIHCHRLNWAYLSFIPSHIFHIHTFVHIVILEKLSSKLQTILLRLHRNLTFIAVSKNSLKQFRQLYTVSEDRSAYHYGGLYFPDLDRFAKKTILSMERIVNNNKIIVAEVSRMDPLKGVDVFIESCALLIKKFPNLHFVHIGNHTEYVYGEGYYKNCVKRVSNLGLSDNFTFIDYTDDILSYLKYFSVLALPTYRDTLSYINLEASYFGIPIVSTNIDGLSETMPRGMDCFIPSPPSPVMLYEKISLLLSNKLILKKMKKDIRRHVQIHFDAQKNANQLICIYDKFID